MSPVKMLPMSEKYKFVDEQGMCFVTMATVGWVDLFTRWELKHVIIDSLRHCQKEKGLVIHAWCLMPSHLHMICKHESGEAFRHHARFQEIYFQRIVQ